MQQNQNPLAGALLSLTTAVLWGVLPVALKELLFVMDASTVVWYRFLAAALVIMCWLTARQNLPDLTGASVRVRWMMVIAALGLCGNYYFFSLSLNFVNAETSEAVIQLTTLFLILGGVFVYKETFTGIQKVGTGLILTGLLLFFHDRLGVLSSVDSYESLGVLVVMIAAITWTIYALLQKQLLGVFSSVQILFFIYVVSVLVLLPFVEPGALFKLTDFQYALLAFCCLNTLIAYGCFAEALNLWDASKVSAVLALAPLFTIATLKVIVIVNPDYAFTDRLSILSVLGAVLIMVGSALTALMPVFQQRRQKNYARRDNKASDNKD